MTSEGLIKIKVAVYSNPMSSHIFILTNGKLALDTSEIPLFFKIFFFFPFFFLLSSRLALLQMGQSPRPPSTAATVHPMSQGSL